MLNRLRNIFRTKELKKHREYGELVAKGFADGLKHTLNDAEREALQKMSKAINDATIQSGGTELKESIGDYMPKELKQGICQRINEGIKDGSIEINPPTILK